MISRLCVFSSLFWKWQIIFHVVLILCLINVSEIVGSVQLKKYREFLQEYATHLLDIEDALDDTLSDSWEFNSDAIVLDVDRRFLAAYFASLCPERMSAFSILLRLKTRFQSLHCVRNA